MARYDHLPIWATALNLTVKIERAAARFPRAHRYGLGADLRQAARQVCRSVVAANGAREDRPARVEALALRVEDLRLLIQLGKELRAFASFAEFEDIARSFTELGKQCGGWRRSVRAKGKPEAEPRNGDGAREHHCAPPSPTGEARFGPAGGIGATPSYPRDGWRR